MCSLSLFQVGTELDDLEQQHSSNQVTDDSVDVKSFFWMIPLNLGDQVDRGDREKSLEEEEAKVKK